MIQELISTIVQLGIVFAIAFGGYLVFGHKSGFARFIGLIAPTRWAMLWALAACIAR